MRAELREIAKGLWQRAQWAMVPEDLTIYVAVEIDRMHRRLDQLQSDLEDVRAMQQEFIHVVPERKQ